MVLNEFIQEEHGMITVTGSIPEVQEFTYCLKEAISKGLLREELEEHLKKYRSRKRIHQAVQLLSISQNIL